MKLPNILLFMLLLFFSCKERQDPFGIDAFGLEGWQNNLGVHHDMSDYTYVLGLNEGYEGGGTWFPRQKVLLDRPIGWITVHPTITHRHGARSVTNGVRYVLISFCRNGNEGN